MASFTCQFCHHDMAVTSDTYHHWTSCYYRHDDTHPYDPDAIRIHFYKCPHCEKRSIYVEGIGNDVKSIIKWILPSSLAKQFPDYVPVAIRNDYEEAYSILDLSPKASATLSRRCIQGMIRDYWGITKGTLGQEIDALKNQIDPFLWQTIDAVRKIGNIGAHMEKDINTIVDIDPGEAEKLVRLIEILIKEWYINSHERQKLFADIISINEDKQTDRKKMG